MPSPIYVQTIACHIENPCRLVLRDAEGRWMLWAEKHAAPEAIPEPLAHWLLSRPEIELLVQPHMWFHTDDLPSGDDWSS